MKRSGCERLFLALAWLVLLSGCGKSSRPPVSPLPERNLAARPWQGCVLPRAPEGACEGRWGNTRIACNPDRFLDPHGRNNPPPRLFQARSHPWTENRVHVQENRGGPLRPSRVDLDRESGPLPWRRLNLELRVERLCGVNEAR